MFVHSRKTNKPSIVVGCILAIIGLASSLAGCSLLPSSDAEEVTYVCPEGTVNLVDDVSQPSKCVLPENETDALNKLNDKKPKRVGVVLEPVIVQSATPAPAPVIESAPKLPAASKLVASDLCSNFDGVQAALPTGLVSVQSTDGTWMCADPTWQGNGTGHIDPPKGGCALPTPLPAVAGDDVGSVSDASYDLSNGIPPCQVVPFKRTAHGLK